PGGGRTTISSPKTQRPSNSIRPGKHDGDGPTRGAESLTDCERATSDCAKRPVKARTISNQRRPQITSPAAPPKESSTESPLGSRMCLVGTDHGFLSRLVGRDGTIFSALGEPDLFTSTHLAIRGEGRATFRASVNGDFSIALSCWRPGI